MLINWSRIQYLNLGEALLFPRNQVICLKNWKLFRTPTTSPFKNFCWNFTHVSVLHMSTKGCVEFFSFCLYLKLLINLFSVSVQKPGLFWFWQITQVLIKIKNPSHPFVDIGKLGTCAEFQQKLLKSVVVEARQSFQFFRQNTWFLKNNRSLSKSLYGTLHYLISITKL